MPHLTFKFANILYYLIITCQNSNSKIKPKILVTTRVRDIGLQVKDGTLTYPYKVLSLRDIGGKRALLQY
jgi:hypothetical protein